MNKNMKKFGLGAKLWFSLVIVAHWGVFALMYYGYKAMPENQEIANAIIFFGVISAVETALYIWLALRQSRNAFYLITALALLSIYLSFRNGQGISSLYGLLNPAITFMFVRDIFRSDKNNA